MSKTYGPIFPKKKWFKEVVVKIVFFTLGRAFQSAVKVDSELKKEVTPWKDDFTLSMGVLPNGPKMAIRKKDNRIHYLGCHFSCSDLEINFKNIECAFLVLTPQIGAAQAFAERRLSVKGDLAIASSFTRCLNLIIAYLYPKFITEKLVKRVPPMPLKRQINRIYIYILGIPFGI